MSSSLFHFLSEIIQQEVSKITEPKRSGLSLDQLGLESHGGVKNIIKVYNQATPEEKDYWGRWYHNAKTDVQELAVQFNLPFPVVAGIVAVLSPGNKWSMNLLAAERLLQGQSKINAYPRQVQRARRILETGDIGLVSGPKVTVFFNSLVDPKMVEKDMVLDGHAINIWRGEKVSLKNLTYPNSKERTQMIQDYQTAAKELGVPVQAVQAVTWYIWKYTGKTAPLEAPTGVYDVSQFVNAQPANDNSIKPMTVAIGENLDPNYYMEEGCAYFAIVLHEKYGFTLAAIVDNGDMWDDETPSVAHVFAVNPETNLAYDVEGEKTIQQIKSYYHDLSSPQVEYFRSRRELEELYMGDDKPLFACSPEEIKKAKEMLTKLESKFRHLNEVNALGAGGIVGAGMGNGGTDASKKLLWSGDEPLKENVLSKKILLLVHPDIVFEMAIKSMQAYYKLLEEHLSRFDHVIVHLFYSPNFEPSWLSQDETKNHIFKNYMKMLRNNAHVVKWDNPRFSASFQEELPDYLIDNPNSQIFLAGGYKDLCLKATREMIDNKLQDIINDTNTTISCYQPLIIQDRSTEIFERVVKKTTNNVLDKMQQKHVGGAPRKSPYGDTYVGFSSGSEEDTSGRDKQAGIVKKVNKNLNKKPYTLHDPPSMGISITRPSLKDRK